METRTALPAFLASGGVFVATLLPGLGHSGDSAELSTCARLLGVPHPTGYPLYLALGHLFQALVPLGSAAWRANLLSAAFAAAAVAVVALLLRRLGAPAAAALGGALALAVTPTFWRHAVVAEVYSLHALLFALVVLLFLRWAEGRRPGQLYAACAVYALSFGNHLLMVTLLPALAALALGVEPSGFADRRRLAAVAAIVLAGAAQYLLLLWLGAAPATPYRAAETGTPAQLFDFVTGAQFQQAMFAFPAGALLGERLPLYLATAWSEFGPALALAALGAWALGRSHANLLLGLAYLGNLAFALGYDIPDLAPYFIPNHLVTAVWLGAGLARLAPSAPRTLAAGALLLPLLLAWAHRPTVERERGDLAAARMRLALAELPRPALLIAGYHEYQFLLHMKLVEGRGAGLFAGHLIEPREVAGYLLEGDELRLAATRERLPPGLPVFSAKLNHRPHYRGAGLAVEPWRHGILRLSRPVAP